ncbi:UNVERIFIED_CONTAM: hypothetical protein RMT77_003484 [Armadillidium vulgare]
MFTVLRTNSSSQIRSLNKISKNSFKISNLSFAKCFSSQNKNSLNFAGIFPPIPTPFNSDETVAYDKLQSNIQKWNKIPFRGFVIEGSTGEYVYLSTEEKLQVIKKSRGVIGKDKLLIAGSGCESTRETIELTNKIAELGVDAVMVVTPSYYKAKMTDQALIKHYEEVANNTTVPIILYNVPGYTNVDLGVEAVAHLSQHPNIVGMKESGDSVSKVTLLLKRTKNEDFQLVVGSAGFLLPSLFMGAVGGICSLANVLGKELCDLFQLYTKGPSGKDEAVALQSTLVAPNIGVTKKYGIAGLKEIMETKGLYGGPTRSPLQKLTPEELEDIKSMFKGSGHL